MLNILAEKLITEIFSTLFLQWEFIGICELDSFKIREECSILSSAY